MGNGCCKQVEEKNSEVKLVKEAENKDLVVQHPAKSGNQYGSYYHFTHNAQNPLQGKYMYEGLTATKIIPIGDTSSQLNTTAHLKAENRIIENGTATHHLSTSPVVSQINYGKKPAFSTSSFAGVTNTANDVANQAQPQTKYQPSYPVYKPYAGNPLMSNVLNRQ